jgi:hypothetical protein
VRGGCTPSDLFCMLTGIIGGNSEVLVGGKFSLNGLDKTLGSRL